MSLKGCCFACSTQTGRVDEFILDLLIAMTVVSIILFLVCCFVLLLNRYVSVEGVEVGKNRILAMILSFEFIRTDPIIMLLHEYRSMCEAGWNPTVMFLTTNHLSESVRNFFKSKAYCYRIKDYIPIQYTIRPKTLGNKLAEEAKSEAYKYRNDFDVFIYQEEDIILLYSHLVAYVAETQNLIDLLGVEGLQQYSLGFQRYCRILQHPSEPRVQHFVEKDLLVKEYLDEFPFFKPVCIKSVPYIAVTSCPDSWMANTHQAAWILTKQQLDQLDVKCHFLNLTAAKSLRPAYVREYTSSLSLFENHIVPENCHLTKLLPAERMSSFLIQHYYCKERPNEHKMVYGVETHVKAGLLQMSSLHSKAGYYDDLPCWQDVIKKYSEQMNVLDDVLIKFGQDKQVYLLENGRKRRVMSGDVFNKHNFRWEAVITIEHKAVFDALPLGPDLDQ